MNSTKPDTAASGMSRSRTTRLVVSVKEAGSISLMLSSLFSSPYHRGHFRRITSYSSGMRHYFCRFPEFDSVAFRVHDPSELSKIVFHNIVVNSHSLFSQLTQGLPQVTDTEVDHELR